ncbi:MAG: DUF4383 domain-containing protein [Bdellovibrionota bacterium]
MGVRKFALIGGAVMLAMGVLALIPGLSSIRTSLPALNIETSYGLFLGFFPMNILNKLALILFGVTGVAASRMDSVEPSVQFSRTVCVVMGVLAVLGVFPATDTLGGYWPLFGGEVTAHGVFAILGGYFGYGVPARARRDVEARA